MRSTIPTPAPRTHANALRRTLDEVRATSQPPAKVSEVSAERHIPLGLIRAAATDCELSQKALALNAGCTESEMSDALAGRRNFALAWIWAQDDAFLLRFLELAMQARGLTPDAQKAVRAERIAELVRLLLMEAA